jgi:3-hydroxy-9,10-secoandrosta-1,3,5(10)-triene-9,17-dione monooxygenase reductase component
MRTDFDAQDFKDVMGRFPTGVAVITAVHDGVPVGFTCQSFVSLSLAPPLISLSPAKTSTTWPRVRAAGTFCVNVLEETQAALCAAFARSGGDKFTGVDWQPGTSGAPLLAGATAWIECCLETAHEAGDHEVAIGRVLSLAPGHGRPLVFCESRLAQLKPPGASAKAS